MPTRESLIGSTFGKLKVIADAPSQRSPDGTVFGCSLCRCACGTEKVVRHASLKHSSTKSCGLCNAYPKGVTVHGHARRSSISRTYRAYCNMIQRCTNPKCDKYEYYGGAGVSVCAKWAGSFDAFLKDVGECPPDKEIDRVDNCSGYEPQNVRWSNAVTQSRNRRSARVFTIRGKTACLSELCEFFGQKYIRVLHRLRRGWGIERAMFLPKIH